MAYLYRLRNLKKLLLCEVSRVGGEQILRKNWGREVEFEHRGAEGCCDKWRWLAFSIP